MLIRKTADIAASEITDEKIFRDRRRFLRDAAAAAVATALRPATAAAENRRAPASKLDGVRPGPYKAREKLTSYEDVTGYNNFYELGTDKRDPARYAAKLKTRPWAVAVEGECERPAVYDVDDLIKPGLLEERVYRLRCVEAWSMVIPWVGIPLAGVLKRFKPTSRAKYVEFTTLYDPDQMPGQRHGLFGSGLDWPYREGLRLDETMHPLTILAVGLYGEILPNQNGAPIRLVVPWKYGFKSIKSIVKIRFSETRPQTTWSMANPREYGFYANVNPNVDHPRWSQAYERRIGEDSLFSPKRKTLMFNGYADLVASLYAGMDLGKHF